MFNKKIFISEAELAELSLQAGIAAFGSSPVSALNRDGSLLKEWLEKGMHGEMAYLERHFEKRVNPVLLVEGAKTIISVVEPYAPNCPTPAIEHPKISRYALVPDYHVTLKRKLHHLLRLLQEKYGEIKGRCFVDSAPLFEKVWAVRAGLGWIGKHGLLINPRYGSYVFIGELVIDAEVNTSPSPLPSRCGSCTRCLDACPTSALVAPKVLDARRCISYLTIEKRTALTPAEQGMLSGWCFGCDVCQEVCPWNSKTEANRPMQAINMNLRALISAVGSNQLEPSDWKKAIEGSALERVGLEKMKENLGFR